MATEKNDAKILELKGQIKEKKNELSTKKTKFSPETNCVLTFNQQTYNLNVLTSEELLNLMISLNVLVLSARDLNVIMPKLGGYFISEWITDIKNKLEVIQYKTEEDKLRKLEIQLDKLLSDDKRTELEIEEIMKNI